MSTQPAPPRRIGVFGGAFDPPHRGHTALAQAALEHLDLDLLLVVPTGTAWHKSRPLSDAQHRLAMCALAFGDVSRAQIDDCEIVRSGPSYTVDTLQAPGVSWRGLLSAHGPGPGAAPRDVEPCGGAAQLGQLVRCCACRVRRPVAATRAARPHARDALQFLCDPRGGRCGGRCQHHARAFGGALYCPASALRLHFAYREP